MPILGGLIAGGGSLAGGLFQAGATSDAASQVARAAEQAGQLQLAEFGQTQRNLMPWLQTGTTANQVLSSNFLGINGPTGAFNPNAPLLQNPLASMGPPPRYHMHPFTADIYQQSPGYNAALQGGTQALQNAGATTTGAMSGNVLAALRGYGTQAANQDYQQGYQNYATNYQNQFGANNQNFWNTYGANSQTQQNIFNWLSSLGGSGQNAAAQLGGFGQAAAGNVGNAIIGAGQANAAGTIGSSNALTGGFNNALTALLRPTSGYQNSTLSSLLGGGLGGGASSFNPASVSSLWGGGGEGAVAAGYYGA